MPAADYLLVVVVAVVLSGANVVGYTKCSKQASAQLKSYATQAVTSGLTVGCCCHALLAALISVSFDARGSGNSVHGIHMIFQKGLRMSSSHCPQTNDWHSLQRCMM